MPPLNGVHAVSSAGRTWAAMSAERRRLLNWLLCWVVAANAAFVFLWPIGSPPRYPDIIAMGAAGLLVRDRSAPLRYGVFIVMLFGGGIAFLCRLFQISPSILLRSLRHFPEIGALTSPEYFGSAVVVVAVLAAAAVLLRRDGNFAGNPSLMVAVAAILGLALGDYAINSMAGDAFAHPVAPTARFESAVQRSGFGGRTGARHNLVLVVVESMGMPRDPVAVQRMFGRFDAADVQARYAVSTGTTRYSGSTTPAEVRELCGLWGNYPDFLDKADAACLPAVLARQGYTTTAIHGFDRDFFDRAGWYPHIGFGRILFRDDLTSAGIPLCGGGVFPGSCDNAIPAMIAARLRSAKGPQFVYWLTLNSHLPIAASAVLGTQDCARWDAALDRQGPMACRLAKMQQDLFDRLARDVLLAGGAPTDVLLVGDHMPPFFDRRQRRMFVGDRVPWVLLRARDDG